MYLYFVLQLKNKFYNIKKPLNAKRQIKRILNGLFTTSISIENLYKQIFSKLSIVLNYPTMIEIHGLNSKTIK